MYHVSLFPHPLGSNLVNITSHLKLNCQSTKGAQYRAVCTTLAKPKFLSVLRGTVLRIAQYCYLQQTSTVCSRNESPDRIKTLLSSENILHQHTCIPPDAMLTTGHRNSSGSMFFGLGRPYLYFPPPVIFCIIDFSTQK